MSREILENIKRKLYAESMGRCMNPNCKIELFQSDGDIIEKAHIDPYCETADNSYENLVVLCPNCHTKFDKLHQFAPEEVLNWKRIRSEEIDKFFAKKFKSFKSLKSEVFPLLLENKSIYENYYLNEQKELWDKFENKILINNTKLKKLLENNLNLFQSNSEKSYSNLHCIQTFIMHINEFEATRPDEEKKRHILFPKEINSIFGIAPIDDSLLPSTESLEALIEKLIENDEFIDVILGIESPYIQIKESGVPKKVYLTDTPRLRQMYFTYKCFRKTNVRLDSLNFALKYIKSRRIKYEFLNLNNLRTIRINNTEMIFVYEYCLSKAFLSQLTPPKNSLVVNLYYWNGHLCISKEAYEFSDEINVKLLDRDAFFGYINGIKK